MKANMVGSAAARWQAGIAPEDAEVFRAVTLADAAEAARIVSRDIIARQMRGIAEVGLILDLMPGHLRPSGAELARELGITIDSTERREIAWELLEPRARFDLVARAMRLLMMLRAGRRNGA